MSDERKVERTQFGPGMVGFRLSDLNQAGREAPELRDKDNAQTQPKPPVHVQHPRLAPPGMSGIKTSERLGLTPQPSARPSLSKEPGDVRREFKGLASTRSNDRDFDR